jgi:hypothetical protein
MNDRRGRHVLQVRLHRYFTYYRYVCPGHTYTYSKVLFNEEFQGSDPRVPDSAHCCDSAALASGAALQCYPCWRSYPWRLPVRGPLSLRLVTHQVWLTKNLSSPRPPAAWVMAPQLQLMMPRRLTKSLSSSKTLSCQQQGQPSKFWFAELFRVVPRS